MELSRSMELSKRMRRVPFFGFEGAEEMSFFYTAALVEKKVLAITC